MSNRKIKLAELNEMPPGQFTELLGGIFEHSPWVAEEAAASRPFASTDALHATMVETVASSPDEQRMTLINAHPDLAGRLAQQGQLTAESTREQAAAGLGNAGAEALERIGELNTAYREKFVFPFIICARLNKVDAIISAMEKRLANTPEQEVSSALAEVYKIARLRLHDIVED